MLTYIYIWSCLLTRTRETASSKDRRAHRFTPPFLFKIHLKNLQRNRAAPLRPIALQRPSQWPNHQILREQEPCKSSLTISSITRKRKEYNLNVRTSESSLRTLIYLVAFSLLAVTDLDTWLASNYTRAIIWSLLDLGAASDSLFG